MSNYLKVYNKTIDSQGKLDVLKYFLTPYKFCIFTTDYQLLICLSKGGKNILPPHPTMNELLRQEVENRSMTLRNDVGLLDMDLAELYGVETKQINQAVKNNPKKFIPDLYYFETTKEEKKALVENFERFEKLKFSAVNPKFYNRFGVIMMATVLNSEIAINVCHVIVMSFVEQLQTTEEGNTIEKLMQIVQEHDTHIQALTQELWELKQQNKSEEHDMHIQALAQEVWELKQKSETKELKPIKGFQPSPSDENEDIS